jgi:hypothetical protein
MNDRLSDDLFLPEECHNSTASGFESVEKDNGRTNVQSEVRLDVLKVTHKNPHALYWIQSTFDQDQDWSFW